MWNVKEKSKTVLLCMLWLAAVCCTMSRAADAPAVATVVEGSGAQVRLSAGAAFKALEEDMELPSGATVRTDASSRVEVQFTDNSILRVNTMSQATITVSGKSKTVDAESGKVWSHVKKISGGESFEVKTPSVTCGVRGTTFWVEVDAAEGDSVGVEDGEVEVEHRGGRRMRLKKRMKTRLRQGRLEDASEFDPEKREKWERFTEKHVEKRFEELNAELAEVREQTRATADAAEQLVAEVQAFADKLDQDATALRKSLVRATALVKQSDQLKQNVANTLKKGKNKNKKQVRKQREKIVELIANMDDTAREIQDARDALDTLRHDVRPLMERAGEIKTSFQEIRDKNENMRRRLDKQRKRREFDPQWPKLKKLNDAITEHEDRILESSGRLDKALKGGTLKNLKDTKDVFAAIAKLSKSLDERQDEIAGKTKDLQNARNDLEELLQKIDDYLNE